MTSLGMALTLVRGLGQLSALAPCLAPIFIFSDLLKIETTLPEIETALSEIKRQQVGHDFKQGDLDFRRLVKCLSKFWTSNGQNWVGLALIYYYLSMIIIPK